MKVSENKIRKAVIELKKECPTYAMLYEDAINKMGDYSELYNIYESGANCGISGFTYYYDTDDFFYSHRDELLSYMAMVAEEIGETEDFVEMIRKFNILKDLNPTMIEIVISLLPEDIIDRLLRHDTFFNVDSAVAVQIRNAIVLAFLEDFAYQVFRKIEDEDEDEEND